MLVETLITGITILAIFDTILMYLIIAGGNIAKTDEEKQEEDNEQIEYLKKFDNKKSKWRKEKMERIFIDRDWCISYTLLALDSIDNSANKERSIEEFIKEIEVMFKIYTDDIEMKKINKRLMKKLENKKILVINNVQNS